MLPIRLAEPFETLRDISDAILADRRRPKVYLAALGPEPAHRRRVAFMREWLEAGGFAPVYDGEAGDARGRRRIGFARAAHACLPLRRRRSLCDNRRALRRGAQRRGSKKVILAGRPGDDEADGAPPASTISCSRAAMRSRG